jgi:hypothetical protein
MGFDGSVLQIQHDGQITSDSRQALKSKIFCFTEMTIGRITLRIPCHQEGTKRVRHVTLARVAMDAAASGDLSPDENAAAYGEVVWSWRRDPGATLAEVLPSATGARKAASPGRARISRQTIARGKPGCLGCTCQTRVHSFATSRTRRCWRSRRPAFPAPSDRRGTMRSQNSDISGRENENVCLPVIASAAKQSTYPLVARWIASLLRSSQ